MKYWALLFALFLTSCEKTSSNYLGQYIGSVTVSGTTEYYNPPGTYPSATIQLPLAATIFIEDGKVYVDCSILCENITLSNGKAMVNCTSSNNATGGTTVTNITGQIEATGSSLKIDVTNTSETFINGSISVKVLQSYKGSIPKI